MRVALSTASPVVPSTATAAPTAVPGNDAVLRNSARTAFTGRRR